MSDPLKHQIIGVIHMAPMPGDPRYQGGGFEGVEDAARRDLEALAQGGVRAVIIENFGSAPFFKGGPGQRLEPHQVAMMAALSRVARREFGLTVGVNCLRNDALSALGVAAASGASFVRVNVHVGAYVTDQGLIEGEAASSLRYRAAIHAQHVQLWADVRVKHAQPLAAPALQTEVHDCLDRGLATGVIVTGGATGSPVDEALLRQVVEAASGRPVLIGSGLTHESAPRLLPGVYGAVVGTWLKREGALLAPVDPARVRALVERAREIWGEG